MLQVCYEYVMSVLKVCWECSTSVVQVCYNVFFCVLFASLLLSASAERFSVSYMQLHSRGKTKVTGLLGFLHRGNNVRI